MLVSPHGNTINIHEIMQLSLIILYNEFVDKTVTI